jgi:hypothetical protein
VPAEGASFAAAARRMQLRRDFSSRGLRSAG